MYHRICGRKVLFELSTFDGSMDDFYKFFRFLTIAMFSISCEFWPRSISRYFDKAITRASTAHGPYRRMRSRLQHTNAHTFADLDEVCHVRARARAPIDLPIFFHYLWCVLIRAATPDASVVVVLGAFRVVFFVDLWIAEFNLLQTKNRREYTYIYLL